MTSAPKFICRLYYPSDYYTTLGEFSNFLNLGGRLEDEIVVFNGMFGLDGYMMLYLHQDLPEYEYSRVVFEVKLFLDGDFKKPYFHNTYRHVSTHFDTDTSRYVIYAIDEDSSLLQSKLTDKKIISIPSNNNIFYAKDILEEFLQNYDLYEVEYDVHPLEHKFNMLQYRYFDTNPNWRVLDFINYICDENELEWAVIHKKCHVGIEIQAYKNKKMSRSIDKEKDRVSKSPFFFKIDGEARPADLFANYNNTYKCVWFKHWVGKSGGSTVACFTTIGGGGADKRQYFASLEGDVEKANASRLLLLHNSPSDYVKLGRILLDSGKYKTIDLISTKKDDRSVKITEPTKINFADGSQSAWGLETYKNVVARSSPYIDDRAGIYFPVPWTYYGPNFERDGYGTVGAPVDAFKRKAPNSVIFNVEGKEETSVAGPYVYGAGSMEDILIPTRKNPRDFRATFRGWGDKWEPVEYETVPCAKCGGDTIKKWQIIDPENKVLTWTCKTCNYWIAVEEAKPIKKIKFLSTKEWGANFYFDHETSTFLGEAQEIFLRADFTQFNQEMTTTPARNPGKEYYSSFWLSNSGTSTWGNARTELTLFDAGCFIIEAIREPFYHEDQEKVDDPSKILRGTFKLDLDNGNGTIKGQANNSIGFFTRKWNDAEVEKAGESAGWQPYESISLKIMENSNPGPRFLIDMDESYGDRYLNLYNIVDSGGLQDALGLYMYSKGSGLNDNANYIKLKITDDIYLIINGDGTATLKGTGTINIDTSGQVNIGTNASSIILSSGNHFVARDTHSHGYQHVHNTGNLGIPVPQAGHIGEGVNTTVSNDNTSIVKVD